MLKGNNHHRSRRLKNQKRRLVKAERATITAAHNIRKMILNVYDAVVERNRARLTLSPLLPISIYEKRTTSKSSPSFILGVLTQLMDGKATAELRLEPRGLRRHDIARVGDVHKLLHRD